MTVPLWFLRFVNQPLLLPPPFLLSAVLSPRAIKKSTVPEEPVDSVDYRKMPSLKKGKLSKCSKTLHHVPNRENSLMHSTYRGRFSDLRSTSRGLPVCLTKQWHDTVRISGIHRKERLQRRDRRGFSPHSHFRIPGLQGPVTYLKLSKNCHGV